MMQAAIAETNHEIFQLTQTHPHQKTELKEVPVHVPSMREIDDYAFEYSKQIAYKTYAKLPHGCKGSVDVEDVQAELLLMYAKESHLIDPRGKWKSYISLIFKNQSKDVLSKIFDNRSKDSALTGAVDIEVGKEWDDDGVMDYVVIEARNPESLLIDTIEEIKMAERCDILIDEIKAFCRKFEIEYKKEDPLESLIKVLDLTLNKYTEKEFKKLSNYAQKRLTGLGAAVQKNGLYIKSSGGKVRTKGIVKIIRSYFDRGINTGEAVLKELDREKILYNRGSVLVIVPELRLEYGLPAMKAFSKESLKGIVAKEFDQGRGIITVPEMVFKLQEMGVRFLPSSVKYLVAELRKQYGLKTR